jgi:hypothetical protein
MCLGFARLDPKGPGRNPASSLDAGGYSWVGEGTGGGVSGLPDAQVGMKSGYSFVRAAAQIIHKPSSTQLYTQQPRCGQPDIGRATKKHLCDELTRHPK